MIAKEVGEIRRRLKPDKNNISHIRGCYINEKKEIYSHFDQSLYATGIDESEELHAILRRTLSGKLGVTLNDIVFDTAQVADSDEHRLLMALRESKLQDEEALEAFYRKVAETVQLDTGYMVMLAYDAYDVPFKSSNDETMEDASATTYRYFLCSICPVKLSKTALSYYTGEAKFYNRSTDYIVSPPELGFLFPAFDDRATNIYGALYYARSKKENQPAFVDAIFKQTIPLPAAIQKNAFESALGEALDDDCSLEVVQAVQEKLCEMIEVHKESKLPETLMINQNTVAEVLMESGVSDAHVEQFKQKYTEQFGEKAAITPDNVVNTKQLKLETPDVTIQVNPQRGDLVQTRIIDGTKYILIRAEEGVEVNGINVVF